jgi:hypothetical protein
MTSASLSLLEICSEYITVHVAVITAIVWVEFQKALIVRNWPILFASLVSKKKKNTQTFNVCRSFTWEIRLLLMAEWDSGVQF